ncbi:MAG: hypothetical protein ACI8PT_003291 [Gammaproteobacteria bacterium]|jgi:hypothetical protein
MTPVLTLDIAGRPIDGVSAEEVALLYCRQQIAWEAGTSAVTLHAGIAPATGQRSVLQVNTILATRRTNRAWVENDRAAVTNTQSFPRDGFMYLYCGLSFSAGQLPVTTSFHVPKGGANTW